MTSITLNRETIIKEFNFALRILNRAIDIVRHTNSFVMQTARVIIENPLARNNVFGKAFIATSKLFTKINLGKIAAGGTALFAVGVSLPWTLMSLYGRITKEIPALIRLPNLELIADQFFGTLNDIFTLGACGSAVSSALLTFGAVAATHAVWITPLTLSVGYGLSTIGLVSSTYNMVLAQKVQNAFEKYTHADDSFEEVLAHFDAAQEGSLARTSAKYFGKDAAWIDAKLKEIEEIADPAIRHSAREAALKALRQRVTYAKWSQVAGMVTSSAAIVALSLSFTPVGYVAPAIFIVTAVSGIAKLCFDRYATTQFEKAMAQAA